MRPVLVIPPTGRILSLPEVKQHLRVDHAEEDALIDGLIDAAHSYLDGLDGPLGRCLTTQTWRLHLPTKGAYRLPYLDVVSVTGATWSGYTITLDAGGDVEFTCAMPEALLPTARQAMLLLIGNWYENRQATSEARQPLPLAFDMLVDRLRRMTV